MMNGYSEFDRPRGFVVAVASALATLIAIGLLGWVASLFHSRGVPFEELAAAERACAAETYASGREVCMREWVAAAHGRQVARH
jgi:hypothetical protein